MKIDLNKNWLIKYKDIECGADRCTGVLDETDGWMCADLPCDVHEPLVREGIIKEPLEGLNSFDSEWIEEKSWWFKKSFNVDNSLLDADVVELVMESLDIGADIFVNNQKAGRHISAFYPFRKNVKDLLKAGENYLLVRLTTGLDMVDLKDCEPYKIVTEGARKPGRGDVRRAFLRKPQYSYGWDWGPRVSTCCIPGRVWIESHKKVAIRGVQTHAALSCTTNSGCTAELTLTIEIENLQPVSTLDGTVRICISSDTAASAALTCKSCMDSYCADEIVCETDVLLKSGLNYISIPVKVENAKLWWPNGMGEQPLYNIRIDGKLNSSDFGDVHFSYPEFKYGIRTVSIDTARIRDGERLFAITINNVRTFCKGGNWIPADSIYSRVFDAKYERLIAEASEANFNMLRIWGGGLYERDIFYELCDRYGILLWHDMMFACSDYPEDHAWFLEEVERELDYQTKRLRNHPSVVLWSGNNENQANSNLIGLKIYNYLAPETVQKNCPDIPYWNSSPYGGINPNDSEIGDRHHWGDCMMNKEMMKRIVPEEYDKVTSKFVSEYGYVGPLKRTAVEKYLCGEPFDIQSDVWQHHNNAFEKDTVLAGIRYHYRDTENMDIDNYLLYAGLCQGLMYAYSLEALRYKSECYGGLFWMYNDCWGETGWTIVDYYLTRKISYYFVKRAFSPVKLIMRDQDVQYNRLVDKNNGGNDNMNENGNGRLITVVGINETPEDVSLEFEYGYVSFDGKTMNSKTVEIMLPHFSRDIVMSFEAGSHDEKKGTYFARTLDNNQPIPLALLRKLPHRDLDIPSAYVQITGIEILSDKKPIGEKSVIRGSIDNPVNAVAVTVQSGTFAHAVHFRLPDEVRLSDEYFDLFPGENKRVFIYDLPEKVDVSKIVAYAVNM